METVVFKPKYSFARTYLGPTLAFAGGAILIALDIRDIGYLTWGGLLCLAGIVMFNAYPREIVLAQSEMTVRRWLFSSQTFAYPSFEGIKGTSIVFKRGAIPLLNMHNAQDLIDTLNKFVGNAGSVPVSDRAQTQHPG